MEASARFTKHVVPSKAFDEGPNLEFFSIRFGVAKM
jgi:hypothetical protein